MKYRIEATRSWKRLCLAALLALVVSGCGGGGGSSNNNAPAGGTGGTGGGGGASGTVVDGGLFPGGTHLRIDTGATDVFLDVASGGSGASVDAGDIEDFGSILINDRTINTDNAEFFAEGAAVSESELSQGQTVLVITDSSGDATGVHYRANVKGPATSVTIEDALLGRAVLVVLGQTVRTNAATSFSDVGIADLLVGDLYEISGTLNSAGEVLATFVQRKMTLTEYKVVGEIENLTASTFSIGGLTVDYASAALQDFSGSPVNGDVVEVEGVASNFTAPDQFVADQVERLPELQVGDAVVSEIDGYIDDFTSVSDFTVQTFPVRTAGSTSFINGDSSSLALGVKVKVRGQVESDGTMLASEVVIQPTNAVRAEGHVETIDIAAESIEVLGVTFELRDSLRLEDDSSAGVDPFTLADLGVGDEVEVRAYLDGTRAVATRLERDDPVDDARLRGPVTAFDAGAASLAILGVNIATQAGVTDYQDENGAAITAADFFSRLSTGTFVEADWDVFTDTTQVVDELSLESDD